MKDNIKIINKANIIVTEEEISDIINAKLASLIIYFEQKKQLRGCNK